MANMLQSFTDPRFTKAVWIVAPAYHLSFGMFEDAGFEGRLMSVPEEEDGVDLEWLEARLEESDQNLDKMELGTRKPGSGRKFYRHIIYTVPTCANPSGKTMSLETRQGLVALARKHNALIICDDVYDLLQWPILQDAKAPSELPETPSNPNYVNFPPVRLPDDALLPRLADIDFDLGPSTYDDQAGTHFGHAISNGSFSKILGPGIRTGWVQGTPAFIYGLSQTGSTRSGGAPSQFASTIVSQLLSSGKLDEHIDTCVRPGLQRRHAIMVRAAREHLAPLGVSWLQRGRRGRDTFGGYFLWLTLPFGSVPAAELARQVEAEEGVLIAPGELFAVSKRGGEGRFARNVRLCFAWEDEDRIEEAIRGLARVLRRSIRFDV
ncbi:hypothetical protein ACHAQA_001466 [Verticillium albo-atrum]